MPELKLDCIVRFHDSMRLMELRRCVFSIVGQEYPCVNIILATQRFSAEELRVVRDLLNPILAINECVTLTVVNWQLAEPADARTELLNLGLSAATGRYVAFLDYDDTIFPWAYKELVSCLDDSHAAIAFGSVRTIKADVYEKFVGFDRVFDPPFAGSNLVDLMRANFCPIHSYVIDREKIPSEVLIFDSSLIWEEDYDLLLRVCACADSDFSKLGRAIGDYYFKNDASNSVWVNDVLSDTKKRTYEQVSARIEARRRVTLIDGSVQQRCLGIDFPIEGLTIRAFLNLQDETGSEPASGPEGCTESCLFPHA